jgi:branched-chain amino acid transport system ATP-binding protein
MSDTTTMATGGGVSTAVPALELRDVEAGYGQTTILRGVSLIVPPSSVVALLGPNGAGKSTLLMTVAGLIRPTKGQVLRDGEDVTGQSPNKLAKNGLCLSPEGHGIFRSLSVRENLVMQSIKGQEAEAIARSVEAFPILGERLTQIAGTLSGGQQQMLAVCRAYVRNPSLILVDEASLGLAPLLVDEIFHFLEQVTKQGAALLIVDQFVTRALKMASYAYLLNRGEIAYAGSPEELLAGDVFERYLGTGQH